MKTNKKLDKVKANQILTVLLLYFVSAGFTSNIYVSSRGVPEKPAPKI